LAIAAFQQKKKKKEKLSAFAENGHMKIIALGPSQNMLFFSNEIIV